MKTRMLTATAAAAALLLTAATVTACTVGDGGDKGGDADQASALPQAARDVMDQPAYANGSWQIHVEDLESGEVVLDLDGDRMAEPGSFVKTYSAGAAWLQWGPDHTITTPVKRTGEVTGGTLQGDLVLVGKGDITMGGRTKPDGTVDFTNMDHNDANPLPDATLTPEDPLTGLNDLAAQVKASGINAVAGDVVVDDRLFQDSLANKPISPIVINQNVIDLMIAPGAVGEMATIDMPMTVAPWKVTSQVETVAAGGETAIAAPQSPAPGEIVVRGTIAADSADQLKIYEFDDPATFARTAFIEALQRAGVTVPTDPIATNSTEGLAAQDAVDALPSVAELESLPLAEEAKYVMKISYNRGAQTFICLLAVESGHDTEAEGGCTGGLSHAAEVWKDAGLDPAGASLIDGSGLDGNLVTGVNATSASRILLERPDGDRWKATLPILGVDGSLTAVQTDSPSAGKVFAKTGSLIGGDFFNVPGEYEGDLRYRLVTKTLGGVMETEGGRTLVFSIVVNNGFYPKIDGVLEANEDVGKVAASIQQAY